MDQDFDRLTVPEEDFVGIVDYLGGDAQEARRLFKLLMKLQLIESDSTS
jgi:hypothetical protein